MLSKRRLAAATLSMTMAFLAPSSARAFCRTSTLGLEAGCVIGEDYPAPIVDHAEARERALARYRIQ